MKKTTHTDVQKDMVVIGDGINAVQITNVTLFQVVVMVETFFLAEM